MKTVYEFKGERQSEREYQADIGDDRWIRIRRRKKQHYLVIADSRALICLRFVQIGLYSDACCGQIVRLQHVVLPVEGEYTKTSSRSSECARPVLETASRTICSWATTRAITSRSGLDKSTAVTRTRTKKNQMYSRFYKQRGLKGIDTFRS